jgi:hypothetical protein
MPRSKEVTLGGATYTIEQLPMRANKEWRDSLGAPVMTLAQLLTDAPNLEVSFSDIQRIIGAVKDLLLGSVDLLLEALFRYSPELAADRERIESEAYDDEAMQALGVVITFAYPLGIALSAIPGLPTTRTSTNSRSVNGASGTKPATAGRQKITTKT